MARLEGSAIAWKISLLIFLARFKKPFGCKYIRNQSISQYFFYFFLQGFIKLGFVDPVKLHFQRYCSDHRNGGRAKGRNLQQRGFVGI
jgi:hypothetical protein